MGTRNAARRALLMMALTLLSAGRETQASTQTSGPALTVSLNAQSFGPGDTLILSAKLLPLATPMVVDAYVYVRIPTGQYFSLQLGGALVPGIVPIARGFVPFAYEAPLAQYTFSGGEPTGTYTWLFGLTRAGTMDFVTPQEQLGFTFSTSTPTATRINLNRALVSGQLERATGLLGNAVLEGLREIDQNAKNAIASALATCEIVENSARYQVCATKDERFRFVLMKDEDGVWRVIVW
jgi:hypothetical protein